MKRYSSAFSPIGSMIFSDSVMKDRVSRKTYEEFTAMAGPLSPATRKEIATAVKDWAIAKGAVHTAHIFSPLRVADARAQAAYKLDGLIDMDHSSTLGLKPIVPKTISTGSFFQHETDGSSFPTGGLRSTHQAAAFVTWDKGSPPCVIGDTLYLPSAFVSHSGDALDHKVPLLRSQEAINREAVRLLKHLGDEQTHTVVSNVGWEQEYFLVPTELYLQRPDLLNCGRTLFGTPPARNQEGSENYFGRIPDSIAAYMNEVRETLWEIGVSLNVNHNEVAPSQHELSPIYSQTNVSTDQNVITMDVMDKVAAKHGLKVLWHEKPYAGVNGSGKHANWSLCTDSGYELYNPTESHESQEQFFAFTSAVAYALSKYGDLIRLSVSGAGNDHRLGAQEAPPAIMSLYTGERMEEHIRKIIAGGPLAGYFAESQQVNVGSTNLENVKVGIEDRNRTAPFPFCGNRFEFRAVGSSQNIAFPLACINTAVAEGCAKLSAKIESGMAIRDAVAEMFEENIHVIFNGNGYSDEWPIEAEKRGLLNLHDTPSAVATLTADKNKQLFASQGVLSEHEVEARQVVMFEEYNNQLIIEAETAVNMVQQYILPTISCGDALAPFEITLKERLLEIRDLLDQSSKLDHTEKAFLLANEIRPKLNELREHVDKAEKTMEDWPFPSYEAMMFHHHY